jgi:hypothetical protein
MKERAQVELYGIDYLNQLNQKKSYYKVKNLEILNTPASEYAPVFLNNGYILRQPVETGRFTKPPERPLPAFIK